LKFFFPSAVVWKITPLFASWLASPGNVLFKYDVLKSSSTVLELGCGISGITALSVAPRIGSYVLTDQDYVMKLLHENLRENQVAAAVSSSSTKGRKSTSRPKKGSAPVQESNIITRPLDWELDEVTTSLTGSPSCKSFDAVVACDCIYNDALIEPLVQTCVDACRLRSAEAAGGDGQEPTVCIVAQQLRSAEVFEAWLQAFSSSFRVWRVPDEELIDGLKTNSGFVIHIGILK
jgi:predicted nicotinamide N-methyase